MTEPAPSSQTPQSKQPHTPDKHNNSHPPSRKGSEQIPEPVETREQDKKSVFVENVDYGTTKEELEAIFKDCGKVLRVTILRDKFTNQPRGLAYVEFEDASSVENAIMLSGTELRKRVIRVSPKRTNVRGLAKPKKKKFYEDPNQRLLQGLLGMFNPRKPFRKP